MKKILVPTDFSEEAHNAFDVAVMIARNTGAQIKVLHVIEMAETSNFSAMGVPSSTSNFEQLYILKLMEQTKIRMRDLLNLAANSGVEITQEVDVDRLPSKVQRVVTEENIDLIVMGSKGSSGFEEMLVGSNTEKVVRYATCPVLTIKHRHRHFDARNIVFASDFTNEADKKVETVKYFQQLFKARLHLLYVNTPGGFGGTREIQDRLAKFAERNGLQDFTINIYSDTEEEPGIIHFANEIAADLIMLATHGRTGLSHFFRGSIAEDLINHSYKPVLSFRIS